MHQSTPPAHSLSSGLEAELIHEQAAIDRGVEEYRKRIARLTQDQIEGHSDYGKSLLARAIHPLSTAIKAFAETAGKGAGRRHAAVKYLNMLEPDVTAFIAARVVIDSISTRRTLNSIVTSIGSRIEDEVRFRYMEEENKPLFDGVQRNLKTNPQGYIESVRRGQLKNAMEKAKLAWEAWPGQDKVHLGAKLVDMLVQDGLIQLAHDKTQRGNTKVYVTATVELATYLADAKESCALLHPEWLPMVCPPNPWTNPFTGCYYHDRLRRRIKLVKARTRGYLKELSARDMPVVYSALNQLQATPWRVNGAVLGFVKEVWEAGLEVGDMPPRFDVQLPARPDREKQPELFSAWKLTAGDIFRGNLAAESKRTQARNIMEIAERMGQYPAIWFPYNLDFRGRVYALPQYLHPQGCDMSKGLLEFAEGKPLGKDGARWLAIHVANCYGFDKVSMEERVRWTHEHSDRIVAMANDPLSDLWWTEADGGQKPFQFLAACIEWVGYCTDGERFVSHLPIMVDGSCNGLQHYSAILRDPVCGQAVNLIPDSKPGDIYANVARAVEASLRLETSDSRIFASLWLEYGITRALCKRPVMVLPYGGTREAVRKYVKEHVLEHQKKRPNPFGKELNKASLYLARVMWAVMGEVVVGPMIAMDWLRQVSRLVSKEGLPINWTTPTGFWVQQFYRSLRSRRVATKIGDAIVKIGMAEETDKLDSRRQCQALPPNLVHSLDASALAFTVLSATGQGVTAFAAVHDSYGTHAADMVLLQSCLRNAFVEMYQQHDPLDEFRLEVSGAIGEGEEMPPLPSKGNLEIEEVLRSDFFFA